MKTIGVLALQGAFVEHIRILRLCGAQTCEVRLASEMEGLDGLIIPGGESTTFGKLAQQYGLVDAIQQKAQQGLSIWGTCAGLIFLAKDVGQKQPILGLMDIAVERNAFGRQLDSFEQDIHIPRVNKELGLDENKKFPAVFIRAPKVTKAGSDVEILSTLNDGAVIAVRQKNLLATAFHPELTADKRFHRYFLGMIG